MLREGFLTLDEIIKGAAATKHLALGMRFLNTFIIGPLDHGGFVAPVIFAVAKFEARAGVVIIASSRGLLLPASMTNTDTLESSARRPATGLPAVPPVIC
jgi:hypothetical protein